MKQQNGAWKAAYLSSPLMPILFVVVMAQLFFSLVTQADALPIQSAEQNVPSQEDLHAGMHFLLRSYELGKVLSEEQKEQFVKFFTDIDTPRSELRAGFHDFVESLQEEQKQAVRTFVGAMEDLSRPGATPRQQPTRQRRGVPPAPISEEAMLIYKGREKIENDTHLSQLESCKRIKLVETGLTPEDRLKLHLPAAIKDCRTELTNFWKVWKEVVMGSTGGHGWESNDVARLMQTAELAKSFTTEQRNHFISILTDVNKSAKQIIAELREFAEALENEAQKKKEGVLALAQAMGKYEGPATHVDTTNVSQEGREAYRQIQQIQLNLDFTQMQSCEQSLAIIDKISAEDRAILKLPPSTSDCKTSLDAMWDKWSKLMIAAST